jgi:uncharacterized protein YuzB (UPF0349 family)
MDNLEELLGAELASSIKDIIEQLKKKHNIDNLNYDSFVKQEICEEYLYNIGYDNIYSNVKNGLTSPYAVAKYIQLVAQEDELISRLNEYLDSFLDKDLITWTMNRNLSSTVTFSKYSDDGVNKSILVKYFIDENDKFKFKIDAGPWGWDITKDNLKALLEEKTIKTFTNDIDNTTKSDLKLQYNGMEIVIRKI